MGESVDFPISSNVQLYLTIAGGKDIGRLFVKFEWKAMVNAGYIIRVKLSDTDYQLLYKVATDHYLELGRKEPTEVIFELIHPGITGENKQTGKYRAYITDLDASGINKSGFLEFIAVDPPSYWLNAGACSGKVYTGKVSTVIQKVLEDWFKTPNKGGGRIEVSDTTDSEQNKWWMMRQDPKTFIHSLTDWSSRLSKDKTNWMISSDGFVDDGAPTIFVKEQSKKKPINIGTLSFNARSPSANDVFKFEFLADNFISVFQKQLITQGLSSVSERFMDRQNDVKKEIVHVFDDNTENKWKTDIDKTKGFTKPDDIPGAVEKPHEWSTAVWMVPEHNAGDVGLSYDKYIDGRARQQFLDMLPLVMRLKLRCTGIAKRQLNNAHNLGVSFVKVVWLRPAPDYGKYFLADDWLVYGFHHIATLGHWHTDVYAQRPDWSANAKIVG